MRNFEFRSSRIPNPESQIPTTCHYMAVGNRTGFASRAHPYSQVGRADLSPPLAVAGYVNDQLVEPPSAGLRFPAADSLFQPHDGFDHYVEILVFGPARRADDEADVAATQTKPREQRLPKSLALRAGDRREG